jgi:hypothetical protein
MSVQVQPKFEGGKNIAMKLPSHLFDETAAFYRDVLRLTILEEIDSSVVFEFGMQKLWLDKEDHLSKPEIWLEIISDDVDAAEDYLNRRGVVRRDDIEPLPEGFKGFWIRNPVDLIHLVAGKEE